MVTTDCPASLGEPGRKLWDSVVPRYTLRPDELATLEDACALVDMVAALSQAWADEGKPLTTKGSMGQLVIHPFIAEMRTHRTSLNALWRQLKLPDDADGGGESNQQRSAAQSRWAAARGQAG